jgi:hypothetical protein
MNQTPTRCPLCGGEIAVTRLHCRDCDTTFEGRFAGGPFHQLTPDQLSFVEIFIRCEGKIRRVQHELDLSYPTIRSRLHEVIRTLGYEPGASEEVGGLSEPGRQRILEDLDAGKIDAVEAMRQLREEEE